MEGERTKEGGPGSMSSVGFLAQGSSSEPSTEEEAAGEEASRGCGETAGAGMSAGSDKVSGAWVTSRKQLTLGACRSEMLSVTEHVSACMRNGWLEQVLMGYRQSLSHLLRCTKLHACAGCCTCAQAPRCHACTDPWDNSMLGSACSGDSG